MSTRTRRLLIILNDAQQADENDWWLANVDTVGGGNTFTFSPVTGFKWAWLNVTEAEFALYVTYLCSLASLVDPDWLSLDDTEKADWLLLNIPAIAANASHWICVDDPSTAWRRPLYGSTMIDWQGNSVAACSADAPQLVVVGDSIFFGSGCEQDRNNLTHHMARLLPPNWVLWNMAVPGYNIQDMIDNYAADILPLYDSARSLNVLLMDGTTNYINGGNSGAATYAKWQSYIATAQGDGWVVVGTDCIDNENPGNVPGWHTEQAAFNALFAGDYAGADAGVILSTTFTDGNDSTYYAQTLPPLHVVTDKVHLNDFGSGLAATLIQLALPSP